MIIETDLESRTENTEVQIYQLLINNNVQMYRVQSGSLVLKSQQHENSTSNLVPLELKIVVEIFW